MNFIESVVSSAESAIRNAIYSIESSIKSAISGIESAIKSAISGAESAIKSAISGVESLVRGISSSLQSIGSSILSSISSAVSTITSTISSIGQSILSTVQSISNTIQNVLSNFQNTIMNFLQNISAQLQSTLTSITQTIQSISQSILSTLQNISTSIQNTLQSIFNQIQTVVSNLSQTMQNISQTITSTLQNITTTIQNTVQNFTQTVSQIATSITSTLQSISQTISSGFQTFLSQLGNIVTQVQNMIQNVIRNIQNVATNISQTIQTTIQNVSTSIQTFLSNISATITSAIQGISQTIQSLITPVITAIDWIRQQVSKIPQLPSLIWEYIKPFVQPIFDTIKDIPSKMAEISKAFQGFVNPLVGIQQFFDQIRQKFIDFITNIPNYIKSIADFFGDIAKDPLGWFNENVVKPLADAFSAIGEWIWEHLPDWLKNAITTAQDWFSNAVDWITKGWKDFVDWVSKIPEHIQNLGESLSGAFKPVSDFFSEIWENAQDFVKDPIGSISSFLQNVWNTVKDVLSTIAESALTFLANLSNAVINASKNVAQTIFNSTTAFLSNVAKGVLSGFWKTISGLINASKNLWRSVGKFLSDIIKSAFETIYKNVAKPIEDAVLSLIKRIITGKSRGEVIETIELLGVSMISFIGSEYMARGMQITLRKLAGILSQYRKTFTIRVRGRGGAKGEPAGVGAEAEAGTGGGFTYTMNFDIGYPLRKIADEMEKYADEFRRGYIYGITIWASQPMMRLASATWRNVIPIELPSLSEMRDITRRHMPIKEKFEQHLETMRRYLALYGYNDEVVAWLTTPVTEEGWFVTIVDRFGNTRLVPISLLYELPTPSDIARMMIHDLFTVPGKPELAFQSFKTLMSMKGYYEDIAKFYYLLHYKYPSMSDLWEFSCRVVAKQTWVNVQPTKEEDLGAENTYSPVQLQSTYGLAKFTSEEVSSKLNTIIQNVLRHYAKWHDYAPFAWLDGWTADNLIYLDLMADIPQRIDARWMYKWQVPIPKEIADLTGSDYFDEKALFLIVTSRGMHPKWLEPITIAECMNALAEERTYARTGVINAFKEGFMSLDGLSKTLSHLTDVKILDKDVPVRFLDGEVKLLALRAKYDRALDILRDYFKDLLRGVTENIIPFDGMTKSLKDEINAVAKSLGLENLALDEDYYKLYQPVADSLRKVRTIERIRYWYRYMLYRILYRFSEGFMSKDEFNKTINDIVNNAKLTDEEKKVFVEIAQLMYDGFYKKTKADGILRKLARGVITHEQAKQELIKLGLTEDLADALIEKHAKTYTLSISTLLSYADEVYIPEELLTKKLEILGVPEDERNIILQVFRIRPIKDERAKAIRTQIEKFIEGYIDETTLKRELSKLGKLKEEIDLIVQYAKVEKSMEIYKLRIDAILNRLKRGAITIDEAKKELSKYIVDKEVIEALIEKSVRTYTLSISQLMSYAEYVDIPEEFIKKKLEILGVPEDEIPIILQVFKIRPLKDERAKMIRSVIDAYIDGYIDKELLQTNLKNLGKSPREVEILTEFADFEKSQATAKLAIDAILNRLRRGAITLEEARKELSKYIVDKALIDAMIEKYVRTSVWSPDKLVSMAEYVPIDLEKLVEKANMFGYPEDEVKLYPAYTLARNLNEEIGRIVTELVYLYVYDVIDEETLRKEIDKVRTLNGEVKKYGVDWIVIDDIEKELIVQRAKLRKLREQAKS